MSQNVLMSGNNIGQNNYYIYNALGAEVRQRWGFFIHFSYIIYIKHGYKNRMTITLLTTGISPNKW